MSNKPNLSQIATNSWDNDFDIDSIIATESKSVRTNTSSAPSSSNSGISKTGHVDVWATHKDILDGVTSNSSSLSSSFKDSGTKTPQQIPNQEPSYQTNNDNYYNDNRDPYILAFNLLEEFDLLRMPENVDYDRLDVNTLQHYKDATLDAQRSEALEYVRNQIADPMLLQLFDYAYHGQGIADVPKMQNLLQKEYDFATYDLRTEKAQRAIVNLYYRDGLDPNDNRDKKYIASIPSQLQQLTKDLKLRDEAEIAKKHFVLLARDKAMLEEQRLFQQLQQRDYEEAQALQEQREWTSDFINALDKRKWSDGHKAAVAKETANIRLNNGTVMPVWEYKQNIIFENPALFQMFLDFTSKFDIETGNFVDSNDDTMTPQILNNIVQRLQNKSSVNTDSMGNRPSAYSGPITRVNRVVDAKKDWF